MAYHPAVEIGRRDCSGERLAEHRAGHAELEWEERGGQAKSALANRTERRHSQHELPVGKEAKRDDGVLGEVLLVEGKSDLGEGKRRDGQPIRPNASGEKSATN